MFQLPEMIFFDYGQTLIDETDYDTIRGNHAVLQRAVSNPRQINASQLQKLADELSKDICSAGISHSRHKATSRFSP